MEQKFGTVVLTLATGKPFPWAVGMSQEQWSWLARNVPQVPVQKIPTLPESK